jgi:nitroreductase
MADFRELVARRRSVRQYRPDPVPEELLQQVLEAARWAPSAVNSQPWELILVRSEEGRQALYDLAGAVGLKWPHLRTAPLTVVVCARPLTPWARDDCIFAAQNMLLQAAELGLGTCWIGGFNETRLKGLLGVPGDYVLPGMLTLGYPAHDPPPPPRRELASLIHHETYEGRALDLSHLPRILRVVGKLLGLQRPRGNYPQQR